MRILRGVGSRILSCGCLAGLYETYQGTTVTVLDACGSGCGDPLHRVDTIIKPEALHTEERVRTKTAEIEVINPLPVAESTTIRADPRTTHGEILNKT
jgi:hypothetical protein